MKKLVTCCLTLFFLAPVLGAEHFKGANALHCKNHRHGAMQCVLVECIYQDAVTQKTKETYYANKWLNQRHFVQTPDGSYACIMHQTNLDPSHCGC